MPKKLYKCEVCGYKKSLESNGKKQIVCIDCVERDLLALNNRIDKLEEKLKCVKSNKDNGGKD